MTLDAQDSPETVSATARSAILFEGCASGLANVDRLSGQATYTLYNPDTDTVKFRNLSYITGKGF